MNEELRSVWAVKYCVNPHRPSSNPGGIVVIYTNREDAENFVAIHPQYHYKMGVNEPRTILEIKELPVGQVAHWWKPSFP